MVESGCFIEYCGVPYVELSTAVGVQLLWLFFYALILVCILCGRN